MNTEECDRDVYTEGESVGVFIMDKGVAQKLAQALSAFSGWRFDWHFVAGYVHLKCLRPAWPPSPPKARCTECQHPAHEAGKCSGLVEVWTTDTCGCQTAMPKADRPACDAEPHKASLTAPPLPNGTDPWPLDSVLERLADAADHLRGDHNCDAHGHEGLLYATQAARLYVERFRNAGRPAPTAERLAELFEDAAHLPTVNLRRELRSLVAYVQQLHGLKHG